MTYKTLKTTMVVEAVDIPTMRDMSIDEYKEYVEFGIVFVDHHEILRSAPAEYPIACTKTQLSAFIDYLNSIKDKLGD